MKYTLKELVDKVEKVYPTISLKHDFVRWGFDKQCPDHFDQKYHKCLSAVCKILAPKSVYELGTANGSSAISMAKWAKKVTTFDMRTEGLYLQGRGNIEVHVRDENHMYNVDYSDADLIYVDITHNGYDEEKLFRHFKKVYKGLIMWDDINLFREVWDKFDGDKVETDWHGEAGFGLTYF